MKVIKPLYGVPEAGNHWFNTYHHHHIEKLQMDQSTYDPCLLYTNHNGFGIVGLQTDDTLILANETFNPLFGNTVDRQLPRSAQIVVRAAF